MTSPDPPWHDAFPKPSVTAPILPQAQLLSMFDTLGSVLDAGLLLVDVRRTDYEGGTIRDSLNLPAQSFFFNMGTLYRLCKGDGVNTIHRVVFYCGSSSGRGPRCAAWFSEYVAKRSREQLGDAPANIRPEPECFVLEGGIKAWVAAGDAYVKYVEAYQPAHWTKTAADNA